MSYWRHPTAEIHPDSLIGDGTKIWQHSVVAAKACIGTHCVIGHNCFIASGAQIGNDVKLQSNTDVWDLVALEDWVFVGPSAVFTNDPNPRSKYPKKNFPSYGSWRKTRVREGATIGANATIVCGVTIGRWAMIGAGSVVTKDVPDYGLIIGVPGKLSGWMCECGTKLLFTGESTQCTTCQRGYRKESDAICNF